MLDCFSNEYSSMHAFQAINMDAGTLPADTASDPKAWHKHQMFVQTLTHVTSLLHGVALQHLRSDWELGNLIPYQAQDLPPPIVSYSWLTLPVMYAHTNQNSGIHLHVHIQSVHSMYV